MHPSLGRAGCIIKIFLEIQQNHTYKIIHLSGNSSRSYPVPHHLLSTEEIVPSIDSTGEGHPCRLQLGTGDSHLVGWVDQPPCPPSLHSSSGYSCSFLDLYFQPQPAAFLLHHLPHSRGQGSPGVQGTRRTVSAGLNQAILANNFFFLLAGACQSQGRLRIE